MTTYKRICECCGKEFETDRVNKIYCNSKCANKQKLRKKRGIADSDYDKVCPICGTSFRAFRRTEVFCSRACYKKNYAKEHRDSIREKGRVYREANKEEIKRRKKEYYEANKESISQKEKIKYQENREKKIEKSKSYYNKNTVRVRKRVKEYAKRNKKEILHKAHVRYRTDINYRLSIKCREMVKRCITQGKKAKTFSILGYTSEDLRKWLEGQFYGNMSWENRTSWEIHHIRPLDTFNFTNEDGIDNYNIIKEANALSNLVPLFTKDHKKLTRMYLSEKKWLNLREIQEFIIKED